MKNLMITGGAFVVLASSSMIALADLVDETNFTTFASGDTAKASEVNDNFIAVKNAVNTNNGQFNTHTGTVDAHHARYTDGEATAAAQAVADTSIAAHKDVADAHHTRYTPAEAQAVADAQISTHAGVANAHHDKYTGAEAVTAVLGADGSGSTLDADLLDGNDSTDFAGATHTHTESDITDLGENCPADMVKVGSFCIDTYEAFVTTDEGGTTAAANGDCSVTGSDCSVGGLAPSPIYAHSAPGSTSSTGFTWFQAQQACANVGKRLPTNAEWQMAVAGTPAPSCNLNDVGVEPTGSNGACVSNYGAFDMVGNVNEWVADWMADGGAGSGNAGAAYGNDVVTTGIAAANQGSGASFPAAILRGGSYFTSATGGGEFFFRADTSPSNNGDISTGFRCAK